MDWIQALENMKAKYELLERRMTTNAQTTTRLDQRLIELQTRFNDIADQTELNRVNLSANRTTAEETKTNLLDACSNVVQRYSTNEHVNTINATLETRLGLLEATLAALVSGPSAGQQNQAQQQPQIFNTHTPTTTTEPLHPPGFGNARDNLQKPAADPWNQYASR